MNFLDNGTVLPSGLLGGGYSSHTAFNRTYQNYGLRVGIVVATYPTSDENNISRLTTEYDVLVFEQQEDQGSSIVRYKNCMSGEGLGSIADFFEKSLRKQTRKTADGSDDTEGQNGAVVLILCLDGMTEKAVILGSLTHPNRKTTLTSDGPHLEGEYNGVHVVVNEDGSTSLTFKGATDTDGNIADSSQGPTEIRIEKDGSYQVSHKTVSHRLDKSGKASLTADGDISNTTKANFEIKAEKSVNVTAAENVNINCAQLIATATGAASFVCAGLSMSAGGSGAVNMEMGSLDLQAKQLAGIKAPVVTIEGQVALGAKGGQPVLLLSTIMIGTGNLGLPVVSMAISGYAKKVTAV